MHERRPRRTKFPAMVEREFAEQRVAVGGERDKDLPPINCASATFDKPLTHRPINQLNRAVMLQLEPLGEVADRGAFSFGEAFQGEHQLMLLRLQPRRVGGLLAEMNEATDLEAKRRQRPILRNGKIALPPH